jgi:tryptophan synthase alpha chain
VSGIGRIEAAFARRSGRAALMPYMMGGFPDLPTSRAIAEAYAALGSDLVELGVPFSDPLADGPVIHSAGTRALRQGVTTEDVLEVAAGLAAYVPVVLMCYANPIYARGADAFVRALSAAGVSGLIVPDLPVEEAPALLGRCDAEGVALVPLVAPTTASDRLAVIGPLARGFVYAVSLTGTTGERDGLGGSLGTMLERVRAHTELPVAVGFGIATPEQAAAAASAGADGVIVGTRLVRAAAEADDPPAAVGELLTALAAALR